MTSVDATHAFRNAMVTIHTTFRRCQPTARLIVAVALLCASATSSAAAGIAGSVPGSPSPLGNGWYSFQYYSPTAAGWILSSGTMATTYGPDLASCADAASDRFCFISAVGPNTGTQPVFSSAHYALSTGVPSAFGNGAGAIPSQSALIAGRVYYLMIAGSNAVYTFSLPSVGSGGSLPAFSVSAITPLIATQTVAAKVLTKNLPATSFTPVTGAGGTAPLTYAVAPTLPAGLSINSATGAIAGTPTAVSAAATYAVTVSDANGATASAPFSLTVNSAVTATQVIAAKVLNQSLAAVPFTPVIGGGGTAPLGYSVAPALPPGLTIDASIGAITGTPTVSAAAAIYTVTVTDANAATARDIFSLTVDGAVTATRVIPSTVLTQNLAVAPFTPVIGSGGTAPLGYGVAPALPAGLAMSASTGAITGTPTAESATATYTVTVSDANAATASSTFSLTVGTALTTTLVVPTVTLPVGSAAAPVTPVTASGGLGTLTYSVLPALPAALAFNAATGQISGKPAVVTVARSYTVTVTDKTTPTPQSSAKSFSLATTGTTGLALSATVAPATLSAIGQTISYTFTVTNTGNVPLAAVAVTDSRLGSVACGASSLGPGAATNCTGISTSTAADVAARGIRTSAIARALFNTTTVVSPAVSTSVGIDATVVRTATSAAVRNFLNQRASLITTNGPSTDRQHARLEAASSVGDDDAPPPTGFADLAAGGAPGVSRLPGGVLGVHGPAATLGYAGPRSGSDGFGADAVDRLNLLGRGGPLGDESFYGRDAQPQGPAGFRFSGLAVDGNGQFAFATSLSQLLDAASARELAKRNAGNADAGPSDGRRAAAGAFGLSATPPVAKAINKPGSLDVWVEGTAAYYVNTLTDVRRQGHAALLHTGVDATVMPNLLLGVMGSFDWMSDSSSMVGEKRDGHGWMAGPYLSARLWPNIYLDARAQWGRSTNQIDPLGAYTDTFSTSRALAAAKLTGDWLHGNLRYKPSTEVIWFSETMRAYTNAIGIDIPGQTTALGRAVIGTEVGYRLTFADQSIVEPFAGFKAVWDFASRGEITADGVPVAGDTLHGRIEAGASYQAPAGIAVRALGAYDGIGAASRFRTYQGQLVVSVPLH